MISNPSGAMAARNVGWTGDVLKRIAASPAKGAQTLLHEVLLYNQQFSQSVLKSQASMHAMSDWYRSRPD